MSGLGRSRAPICPILRRIPLLALCNPPQRTLARHQSPLPRPVPGCSKRLCVRSVATGARRNPDARPPRKRSPYWSMQALWDHCYRQSVAPASINVVSALMNPPAWVMAPENRAGHSSKETHLCYPPADWDARGRAAVPWFSRVPCCPSPPVKGIARHDMDEVGDEQRKPGHLGGTAGSIAGCERGCRTGRPMWYNHSPADFPAQ
jgi:hypothetical protein